MAPSTDVRRRRGDETAGHRKPPFEDRMMKALCTFCLVTLAALLAFGTIASAPALAAPASNSAAAA
jgi:hypothetical protein